MSNSSPLPVVKTTKPEPVIRYVAAYRDLIVHGKTGKEYTLILKMFRPCQGRNTHATVQECQKWINSFFNNISDKYRDENPQWSSMCVVKCPCYPNHFDPMKTVFNVKDVVLK